MIQRVLNSKNFLAMLLAMATGTLLNFKMPWPMTASFVSHTWNEYFLRLVALRDPWTYAGLKASYHVMLFTTPYIGYSFLLSALYIFTLRPRRIGKAFRVSRLVYCRAVLKSCIPRSSPNIADSLNVVAQIERRPGRRFVSEVLEIRGYNLPTDEYELHQVGVALKATRL